MSRVMPAGRKSPRSRAARDKTRRGPSREFAPEPLAEGYTEAHLPAGKDVPGKRGRHGALEDVLALASPQLQRRRDRRRHTPSERDRAAAPATSSDTAMLARSTLVRMSLGQVGVDVDELQARTT